MKTLALGKKSSLFYRSINHILYLFGDIVFKSEHDFKYVKQLENFVKENSINQVLMPNPYGNNKRYNCYKKLKEINCKVIASDRGALPNSWFFDSGFNADSDTYHKSKWDLPLSEYHDKSVQYYINDLTSNDLALEKQGERVGGEILKKSLGLTGKKILFVPLQRPNDTVIKFFSGSVKSIDHFVKKVSEVADNLKDEGWVVILKKHPLEKDYILPTSDNARYIYNSAHINDLIEMSDSIMLINSGVGLLAMAWKKPVFHFGEAFYSIPEVNRKVISSYEASNAIKNGFIVNFELVKRFYLYLINSVYSFGTFDTFKISNKDGGYRTETRKIDFKKVNILKTSHTITNKKVVIVTSVVPWPIYRGSQSRIDAVIHSLINSGVKVSLVIMNTSFKDKKSIDIERELRNRYKYIEYLKVIKSPFLSSDSLVKFRNNTFKKIDNRVNKNKAIKWADCPRKFKKAVQKAIDLVHPDSIMVNYVKLTNVIPKRFYGEKIVDTHDFQTQFLSEDLKENGNPKNIDLEKYKKSEIKLLNNYDKLIAINKNEKKLFEKVTNKEVFLSPAFFNDNIHLTKYFLGYEYDALFVGSISNFNVSGLIWFLENVLPILNKDKPYLRVAIVGDVCKSKKIDKDKYEGVYFLGRVLDLKELYRSSKVVIAPILGGAGMKIKVIEALSYGKMVVGTSKAFDGINVKNNFSSLIADTPDLFAKNLISVTANRELRSYIENNAVGLYKKEHSLLAVESSLKNVIFK